jgi:hypothetical protein
VNAELIDTALAKELIRAEAVQGASIVGRPGGWSVLLRLGAATKMLAAQRSRQARLWRSLDRCVSFMRNELGLERFDQLDASKYTPEGPVRRPRADAAARLKQAHEAAAHTRWFRAHVQLGLDDLDAGRVVSDTEHDADWSRRKRALQNRAAKHK